MRLKLDGGLSGGLAEPDKKLIAVIKMVIKACINVSRSHGGQKMIFHSCLN